MEPTSDAGEWPPIVLSTRETSAALRGACAQGRAQRVRRGAYTHADEAARGPVAAERLARAAVRATAAQLTTAVWFSHATAALIWRLPLLEVPRVTHVIQLHRPGLEIDRALVRHFAQLPMSDRATCDDLPVTSLERTVVDCACVLPGAAGLGVADAALRRGADMAEIRRVLARRSGGRGVVRARRVVAMADARAESPGESATRWILLDQGLPAAVPQCPVSTRLGTFFADLGWPELRVAVEFDGAVKYSGAYGGGREALIAEKRRQDAMEEAGWIVLRVVWADLREPDRLAARALRARLRAAHRR